VNVLIHSMSSVLFRLRIKKRTDCKTRGKPSWSLISQDFRCIFSKFQSAINASSDDEFSMS